MANPKDDRTLGERIADLVTHFAGSWVFIISLGIVLCLWIALNTLFIFDVIAFDKKPYILLNLILSFIAAFQLPFILMSQNRTEKKQDTVYRVLFQEIKELVEQDIEHEQEIAHLEKEINEELRIVKTTLTKLLSSLQQAISLEKLTRKDIAEILEFCEEQENQEEQ